MRQLIFVCLSFLCLATSCSKHEDASLGTSGNQENRKRKISTIDGNDIPFVPSDREKFAACVATYWGGVSQGYETVASLSSKVRECTKDLDINATNYAPVIPPPGNIMNLPYISHVNDLLYLAGVTDPSLLSVPEQIALVKDYYSILNIIVQSADINSSMSPQDRYNSFVSNAFGLGLEVVIGYAPGDCIYPAGNLAYGYFHAVAHQNVDVPFEWTSSGFEFYP